VAALHDASSVTGPVAQHLVGRRCPRDRGMAPAQLGSHSDRSCDPAALGEASSVAEGPDPSVYQ